MSTLRNQALKYTLLPGLIPRITQLFGSGFVHITYCLVLIYATARLLPKNHPYLNPANRGNFGIRHVITEAAGNLVFSRKNIDQIFIFFTILSGIALLFLQIILFGLALYTQQAQAQTQNNFASVQYEPPPLNTSLDNIFHVYSSYGHGYGMNDKKSNHTNDIVFMFMDYVFGLAGNDSSGKGGIYDSCVSNLQTTCKAGRQDGLYPTQFQKALHKLLGIYSQCILIVGCLIIIYFITTLVAETAVAGSPFGQRMNKAWAPVRLILFFALILPFNSDYTKASGTDTVTLNGAQVITFWIAKFGSNFATNGWGYFLQSGGAMDQSRVVAIPQMPSYDKIIEFTFIARTCQALYDIEYAPKESTEDGTTTKTDGVYVKAYIAGKDPIPDPSEAELLHVDIETALKSAQNGNITISIGHYKDPNTITPVCGQLTLPVRNNDPIYLKYMEAQLKILQDIWASDTIHRYASCLANSMSTLNNSNCKDQDETNYTKPNLATTIIKEIDLNANDTISDIKPIIENHVSSNHFTHSTLKHGWGGAGLWYNTIAKINGNVVAGMYALPEPVAYPLVMEEVKEKRAKLEYSNDTENRFNPVLTNGKEISFGNATATYTAMAPILNTAFQTFKKRQQKPKEKNLFKKVVNTIIGANGIFDMRNKSNEEIHPMAQLTSLGKSMMQASLRNILGGMSLEVIATLLDKGNIARIALESSSKFLLTMGFAFFAFSVVLFYVLPLLPFIYFLFAMSNWVKSIFEAVVAMPLWALAHIRIDGEGIPGTDANSGYFLLFEIFIRPILVVFGLLASIVLFESMVGVLHDVFENLIGNVGGGFDEKANSPYKLQEIQQNIKSLDGNSSQEDVDAYIDKVYDHIRGPVDEFFLTAIYVALVYMMGLSCFKLIDQIPNTIMRWSGTQVAAFSEGAGDPESQLTSTTYRGISLMTSKAEGGMLHMLTGK